MTDSTRPDAKSGTDAKSGIDEVDGAPAKPKGDAAQPDAGKAKPKPDGDVIAELGDELGGPA